MISMTVSQSSSVSPEDLLNPTPLPPANLTVRASLAASSIQAIAPACSASDNRIEIQLVMRTSSGQEYGFDRNKLSPEQAQRFVEIMGKIAQDCPSFELNLTSLIAQSVGADSQFLSSEQDEIKELRELVRLSLGVEALAWSSYLSDQRGCQSGDQLFACKGSVLTDLKIDGKDRLQALNAPNLITKQSHTHLEKEEILRRHKSGNELINKTIEMLEQIKAGLKRAAPADALKLATKKTSLEKTLDRFTYKTTKELQKEQIAPEQHTARSIKSGAILLEALYPLDLSRLADPQKIEVIREKENAIEKILKARTEDHLDKKYFEPILGLIPHPGKLVPYLRSSDSQYEKEKKAFAKDVALAGIDNRKDFHLYGNKSGSGAELFFIKLQKLIAGDADDAAIEKCLDSSYFQSAFGSLHPHLRQEAHDLLLENAKKLRDVNKAVSIEVHTDNEALCKNFDAEYEKQLKIQFG